MSQLPKGSSARRAKVTWLAVMKGFGAVTSVPFGAEAVAAVSTGRRLGLSCAAIKGGWRLETGGWRRLEAGGGWRRRREAGGLGGPQAQDPGLPLALELTQVAAAQHAAERLDAARVALVGGARLAEEAPQQAALLQVEAEVAGLGVVAAGVLLVELL